VRVHEVADFGTQVRPHDVQLVAEDGADFLQLAVSLRPRRLDPRLLPRTVHELRARGETRVVPHGLRLGDNIRRGVRREARRVVAVENELGEVGIGGGEGADLSKSDTRTDEFHRNH